MVCVRRVLSTRPALGAIMADGDDYRRGDARDPTLPANLTLILLALYATASAHSGSPERLMLRHVEG